MINAQKDWAPNRGYISDKTFKQLFMEMNNKCTLKNGRMDRRSMVKNGTAFIGAGFLGSIAAPPVEPPEKVSNNIFNVRYFGATGNRGDNATMPVRSAIDECAAAGGGTRNSRRTGKIRIR